MATGYKNVQVCKTLVLTLPSSDDMTLKQYKERYGIDLTEYIFLEGDEEEGSIRFNAKDCLVVLHAGPDNDMDMIESFYRACFPVSATRQTSYEGGSADGSLLLGVYNATNNTYCGLALEINKNVDFIIDNIVVRSVGL